MKLNGRTLKRRLFGLTTFPSRVARARYFRGHGVHSPFVYRIVRQVFMKHTLQTDERALYDALRNVGVPHRRAVQLQNLAAHLDYRTFQLDAWCKTCDWLLLTPALTADATTALVAQATAVGRTVVLLDPYQGRERAHLCRTLVEEHRCTSVDKRGFVLLFTHPDLPKQHYRI